MDYGWLFFSVLLASLLGFELIAKVPSQLHTPLMSGTNAISGITLIGALVVLSQSHSGYLLFLGYAGVFFATINIVGGYWVTDRMLKMFNLKNNRKH
ncbi:MAG: NAD(P) transhydrogenase subunit alpha [Puniceicoccales bacterium]|jgi:NAD(P) transhydrogenase subunit alpha|nr:NAD(P) transhydrogenase subunit alpha [Puniceicoccales bacterium]